MKVEMIILGDVRVRVSTIKKYKPYGDKGLVIYYSMSRTSVNSEIFNFKSKTKRDSVLAEIDVKFGL